MVYVDMDGVIADFFGGLQKFYKVDHWKQIPNLEDTILNLRNTDIFYRLPEFETSKALIDKVKSYGDWGICSSPLRNDFANSTYWKRKWLEDKGYMPEVSNCIFTSNKPSFATNTVTGEPNILIDDKPSIIQAWENKGGIGIRYQANEDDLEEYLFEKLEKAINTSINWSDKWPKKKNLKR